MSQICHIHSENPQSRLILDAVNIIREGGIIVCPTDAGYALGCHLNDVESLHRLRQIRHLDEKHLFTLMCYDLSKIAMYAKVNDKNYRLLKSLTPGAYTFLLTATKEVPKRLLHPKRKTIGIRVPDCKITLALLEMLEEPLMSTTVQLPHDDQPLYDPEEIFEKLKLQVDLVIDGGSCGVESTSVVDLTGDEPKVIREGNGDISIFG